MLKPDGYLLSGVAEERNFAAVSINWPEQFWSHHMLQS